MVKRLTQEERVNLHESIAQAMLNVIDKRKVENPDLSLLWLSQPNKNAPEGFWTDVREILNRGGVTRPRGREWAEDNHLSVQYVLKSANKEDIYGRVRKWLGIEVKEAPTKKAKLKEQGTPKTTKSPKTKVASEEQSLHETIKQLIDEVREIKHTQRVQPDRPNIYEERDEPEFPKKATVTLKNVNAGVNPVLFDLLEEETKRQGNNRSRALQIIMWRGLGRPSLISEKTEEKE